MADTTIPTEQICPSCGGQCSRDEANIGIGVIYGPWACYCGWSEDPRYDVRGGARTEGGYAVDQWGGLTPTPAPAEETSAPCGHQTRHGDQVLICCHPAGHDEAHEHEISGCHRCNGSEVIPEHDSEDRPCTCRTAEETSAEGAESRG